jgi:protease-4
LFGFIWEYAIQTHENQPIYRFGAKLGSEKFPKVRNYSILKPKEYLEINLDQSLTAGQSDSSILGGQHLGADLLIHKIRQAAEDKDICGIILKISELPDSISYLAVVQEIREELDHFKAKGKVIIVYLDNDVSAHAYYLASVGDKIVMPKMGAITSIGTSFTVTRLKGLFDKVGLNYQLVKVGAFKDATHPANPGYTDEQRKHIEGLVYDLNDQLFAVISTSRNITSANLASIRDGSIIPGTQALDYKLIDALGYYDTALDAMQDTAKLTYKPKTISLADLPSYEMDTNILPDYNTVAVLDIDGEIMDGTSKSNFLFGGKIAGADTICAELKKLEEKDDIRAIIVRINSPGGSALAADRIYLQLKKLKDKGKFIVISMGNIAASGGYYIASAGDIIIANPGTLTGSIGVIGEIIKGKKLFDYLNVKEETIKTGEYLDMETFGRDLTDAEKQMLNKFQEQVYEQFKLAVAEGRHMHITEVEPLAQGKIYTGKQALQNKLVDRLGSFFDAVDAAKEGAKIKGPVKLVRLIPLEDNSLLFMRSKIVTLLGLDQLSLVNLKTMLNSSLIKFDSYLQ